MSNVSSELFRHVLGHLPTGVTVVTANGGTGPVGMAVNSVTSVSLEPPQVLFCPSKASATWSEMQASGRFCINIFAAHQEAFARQFSRRGVDRFAGVDVHERPGGPAITDAVAWVDCSIAATHEAGDHLIVVGAVEGLDARPGDPQPLVFFRGTYGCVAAGRREAAPPDARHRSRQAA